MRGRDVEPPEFTMSGLDGLVKFSPRISKNILRTLQLFLLVLELLCKIISLFAQCIGLVSVNQESTQRTSAVIESPMELQITNWVGNGCHVMEPPKVVCPLHVAKGEQEMAAEGLYTVKGS